MSPHLVVDDAAAAIDFYVKAFGATEYGRVPLRTAASCTPRCNVNGSTVMLNDDFPEMQRRQVDDAQRHSAARR